MLRKTLASLLFIILSSYYMVLTAQEPLDLEINVSPGDIYKVRMNLTQSITQTIDGRDEAINQEMSMVWRYDVIDVEGNGDIIFTLSYDRIYIRQDLGFETIEYDSDNPPSYIEPAMRGYGALIGKQLQVRIDNKGKVVGLTGAKSLEDAVIAALDIPDSPYRDRVLSDIRNQFGEEALKSSFQQITSFYPPDPILIGDTWNSEDFINTGFPMKLENQYTLKSLRDDGFAEIAVRSIISSDPESTVDIGEVSLFYNVSGEQTGVIYVDRGNGLPSRSEINMRFEGTVETTGEGDQPGQSWPIRANGVVVVTFEGQ